MRISDWSSDVCSSDLKRRSGFPAWPPGEREQAQRIDERIAQIIDRIRHERARARRQSATKFDREHERVDHQDRSEEHTSELQSLMRISYAVSGLKKKTTSTQR